MGEAKKRALAERGALLRAHAAFHRGEFDELHRQLHWLLGLEGPEAGEAPVEGERARRMETGLIFFTAAATAYAEHDPAAFNRAFRAVTAAFGLRACAVVQREVETIAGGFDPATRLITPKRPVKTISFQAHGDAAVIRELQARLKGEPDG